jgi:inhibitor of KinA sporulation pathway (predicted exonuclease)
VAVKRYYLDLEYSKTPKKVYETYIVAFGLTDDGEGLQIGQILKPWRNFKKKNVPKYCSITGIERIEVEKAPLLEDIYDEIFGRMQKKQHVVYAWGTDGDKFKGVAKQKNINCNLLFEDFQRRLKREFGLLYQPSLKKTMELIQKRHGFRNHNPLHDAIMLKRIHDKYIRDKEGLRYLMRRRDYEIQLKNLNKEYKDVI